jgi:hypothetical protein
MSSHYQASGAENRREVPNPPATLPRRRSGNIFDLVLSAPIEYNTAEGDHRYSKQRDNHS